MGHKMVEKPTNIEFQCIQDGCSGNVAFSVLDLGTNIAVECPECSREYTFNEELAGKLRKFRDLILCVRKAEEILGNTNIAIDIEGHTVKIPYRLLLTRLNTLLNLQIGKKAVAFKFRVEPLKQPAT